jgi:hypothetical protein
MVALRELDLGGDVMVDAKMMNMQEATVAHNKISDRERRTEGRTLLTSWGPAAGPAWRGTWPIALSDIIDLGRGGGGGGCCCCSSSLIRRGSSLEPTRAAPVVADDDPLDGDVGRRGCELVAIAAGEGETGALEYTGG